jgi:16S rRNA processing protein RimM
MIDGLPVPFRILEASIRNENSAILTLENYNTPEESRELIGDDVFIESKQRRKSNTSVPEIDEINGYLVIDRTKGKIGLASEVFDFDGNLVLQVWQNKTEILIPVDESIILGVENSKREIYIDAPEGLIDLYL